MMLAFRRWPHLFTFGDFGIRSNNHIWPIISYSESTRFFTAGYRNSNEYICLPIETSVLTARRVDDIKLEEFNRLAEINNHQAVTSFTTAAGGHKFYTGLWTIAGESSDLWRGMSPQEIGYLLTRGVYPFNQQHFKPNQIIARYT